MPDCTVAVASRLSVRLSRHAAGGVQEPGLGGGEVQCGRGGETAGRVTAAPGSGLVVAAVRSQRRLMLPRRPDAHHHGCRQSQTRRKDWPEPPRQLRVSSRHSLHAEPEQQRNPNNVDTASEACDAPTMNAIRPTTSAGNSAFQRCSTLEIRQTTAPVTSVMPATSASPPFSAASIDGETNELRIAAGARWPNPNTESRLDTRIVDTPALAPSVISIATGSVTLLADSTACWKPGTRPVARGTRSSMPLDHRRGFPHRSCGAQRQPGDEVPNSGGYGAKRRCGSQKRRNYHTTRP